MQYLLPNLLHKAHAHEQPPKPKRTLREHIAAFLNTLSFRVLGPGSLRYLEWGLILSMLALTVVGVLCIANAMSSVATTEGMSTLDLITAQEHQTAGRQVQSFFVGAAGFLAVMMVRYDVLKNKSVSLFIYGLNIFLITLVLLQQNKISNVAGWLSIGPDRTIQPSELGKIAMIIALARVFAMRKEPITRIRELLPLLLFFGVPLALIVMQNDLGTAMVYVFIFACMLFASGTSYKIIVGLMCIGVLAIIAAGYIFASQGSFRIIRILTFLGSSEVSSDAALQTENAKIAVGSGQLWGKGLFAPGSLTQLNFVPYDHTDFIFSVIAESFGFIGSALIIGLYGYMMFRMLVLSRYIQDPFGSMLVVGVMAMMLFHVFENIGMVIGVMPVTGIPLPFVSYGGTSLMVNMVGMAIVVNVSLFSHAQGRYGRVRPPRITPNTLRRP